MKKYLDACIESALAGGNYIKHVEGCNVFRKDDRYVGHHAVVTLADANSQYSVLGALDRHDPCVKVMVEESDHVGASFRDRLVTGQDFDQLRNSGVYIVDELDGTSSHAVGHYEWSVSVGCVDRLRHVAGAVYAPMIGGGTVFYASRKDGRHRGGAFVRAPSSEDRRLHVKDRKLSDAYVLFGIDCPLPKYPLHNRLMNDVADKARTTNINGSCALGLGLVASGRADVLVQPLQSPWDWAAGKVLIEESRGKMIFYEMEGDKIRPVERLEPRHYDPSKRAVGFVAGSERLADTIFEMLQRIRV